MVLDRDSSGQSHQEGQCGSTLVTAGELKKRCLIRSCEHRGWDRRQQNGKSRRSFLPLPELKFARLLFPLRVFQSLPVLTAGQVPLHRLSAIHQVLAHVVSPVCLLRAQWWKGVLATASWLLWLGALRGVWQCGLLCGLVCKQGPANLVQSTGLWEALLSLFSWAEPYPQVAGG